MTTKYAFIDANNVVNEIIEGINPDETQTDTDGTTVGGSVEVWETFYQNQTSHQNALCKMCGNDVAIGYTYNADLDEFVAPEVVEP